ncbi:ribosomal L7Ae/L30e/S12e/Gadd45 family protein [Aerococcaceae bacterium NML191292]|nr:ribosomal L7Ae/L30e/S12e/Gadd45 family protein [Aerococcaceae bacterium NML191292]MCW6681091.1 ribosomal L7Ae/L30e/S12e/Gadd45 family protein [Aerococcaceae bacterium NML130460]
MNYKQKQLNMLGLAMRARQLVSGDELVSDAVKKHRVHVVICASDASEATKERYIALCQRENIPLNLTYTKYDISYAIGKSRTLCAISDKGMAKRFLSYEAIEQPTEE